MLQGKFLEHQILTLQLNTLEHTSQHNNYILCVNIESLWSPHPATKKIQRKKFVKEIRNLALEYLDIHFDFFDTESSNLINDWIDLIWSCPCAIW